GSLDIGLGYLQRNFTFPDRSRGPHQWAKIKEKIAGKAKVGKDISFSVEQEIMETEMNIGKRPEESSRPIKEMLRGMEKKEKTLAFAYIENKTKILMLK
ncbi:hypothetical protein PIB30_085467, partial [Stylosanthes scabra]|nr:hypothetical protein [Stylosanthes scabra]